MLFTSERVRPCSERFSRSSSGRSTRRVSPSWRTTMAPGTGRDSWPFGPFTVTAPPAMVTSTPLGTVIGALPMRLTGASSPHVAEDFAAHAALARLTVGHEPLAGRQDGHPEPAEHTRHPVGLGVHPETGLRHPAQTLDGAVAFGRILHRDREHVAGPVLGGGDAEAL